MPASSGTATAHRTAGLGTPVGLEHRHARGVEELGESRVDASSCADRGTAAGRRTSRGHRPATVLSRAFWRRRSPRGWSSSICALRPPERAGVATTERRPHHGQRVDRLSAATLERHREAARQLHPEDACAYTAVRGSGRYSRSASREPTQRGHRGGLVGQRAWLSRTPRGRPSSATYGSAASPCRRTAYSRCDSARGCSAEVVVPERSRPSSDSTRVVGVVAVDLHDLRHVADAGRGSATACAPCRSPRR